MNPTEHEQIRAYFCERFPCETLTDDEIASLAKMPLVVRLCASGARSVDGFLRGLPDDLLTRVILLLHDFSSGRTGERQKAGRSNCIA